MKHKIHKYKRINISSREKPYYVYKCMLPNCSHYMPPHLVIGKYSLCWKCDESFIMLRSSAKLAKPYCGSCGGKNTKKEPQEKIETLLKELGLGE